MLRKPKNRAGVIGLGPIGSKVAAGLRAAGFSVYVWNRTPRAEPNFLGSAVEVVDLCEVVQLFLPHDAALIEVLRTVGAALRPEHVVCGHATVAPDTARQAAALVEGCGARYVDAPFAGSRADAEARRLAYFVGGTEEAVHAARPVLQATARRVLHVGNVGDAALLKLAAQTLNAVSVQGVAEALAVLLAGGGDPEKLREVLAEEPSYSALVAEKLAAMVAGQLDPVLPVRHVFRDLQTAMRLAGSARAAVPAAGVTAGILFGAVRRGQEDRDVAVLGVPQAAGAGAVGASGLSATVSVPTPPLVAAPTSPAETPEPAAESASPAVDAAPPAPAPELTPRATAVRPARSPTVSFVPLTPRPTANAEPAPEPAPVRPTSPVSVPVAAMLAPLHRAAAAPPPPPAPPPARRTAPVLPAFRGHGPITNRIPHAPQLAAKLVPSPLPPMEPPLSPEPPESPLPSEPSLEEGIEEPPASLEAPLVVDSPDAPLVVEEPADVIASPEVIPADDGGEVAAAEDSAGVVAPGDIRPPGLPPLDSPPGDSPGARIGPPPRKGGWMKRLFGGPPR